MHLDSRGPRPRGKWGEAQCENGLDQGLPDLPCPGTVRLTHFQRKPDSSACLVVNIWTALEVFMS